MLSAAVYQLTRKNLTVPDPMDTSYQIQAGKARSRGLSWKRAPASAATPT